MVDAERHDEFRRGWLFIVIQNIVHIVGRIDDLASGPSYSVTELCEQLAKTGASVTLRTMESGIVAGRAFEVATYPRPWWLKLVWGAPELKAAVRSDLQTASVVHNHGLWILANQYCALPSRRRFARTVVSPRGTLASEALAISPIRKRLASFFGHVRVLTRADCLHATSDQELQDIRDYGLRNPVAVIPNGIMMPASPRAGGYTRKPFVLFIGRIHAIKGIDLLLHSWRAIQSRFAEWSLRIAGPDDGYLDAAVDLARQLGCRGVSFVGPVFGDIKRSELEHASLFVLPSRSENFGMAVAEALSFGIPVLASRGTPWKVLRDIDAGWWFERTPEALSAALSGAMSLSVEERAERGHRGQEWAAQNLSWPHVARMMLSTYEWLTDQGRRPPWVNLA